MIRKIGWRNIWRNRGRSLVVIGAIAIGIWALIFMYGFMNSFLDGYVKNQINFETSHIQIHHPEFKKDYETKYVIPNGVQLISELRETGTIEALSGRAIVNGMIASPRKASGIKIVGIIPEDEAALTRIDSFVTDGTYFETDGRNPVLIGYKLAEKLKVEVRSKVVLTFQDADGEIISAAFRVSGIIESRSPTYNELSAFVRRKDLNQLLDMDGFHELAIMVHPEVDELKEAEELSKKYPNLLVESWKELAPELEYFLQSSSGFMAILQVIIMIALIFGIINTMLMSVLERVRELGMLMAVGMNKRKVYGMIMLETLLLALVGSPVGLIISMATMYFLSQTGIDLSNYSAGLEEYGYDNVLYPYVESITYVKVLVGVFITALLGALYPAYKAVKLNPVEALHKI